MEKGINYINSPTNSSSIIINALLGFKGLASKISNYASNNSVDVSNLGLYVLISLFNEKPLLRNDLMKSLKVNYYDAGKALDSLIDNNHVIFEVSPERSNIKRLSNNRKLYRLTLKGCYLLKTF